MEPNITYCSIIGVSGRDPYIAGPDYIITEAVQYRKHNYRAHFVSHNVPLKILYPLKIGELSKRYLSPFLLCHADLPVWPLLPGLVSGDGDDVNLPPVSEKRC